MSAMLKLIVKGFLSVAKGVAKKTKTEYDDMFILALEELVEEWFANAQKASMKR